MGGLGEVEMQKCASPRFASWGQWGAEGRPHTGKQKELGKNVEKRGFAELPFVTAHAPLLSIGFNVNKTFK